MYLEGSLVLGPSSPKTCRICVLRYVNSQSCKRARHRLTLAEAAMQAGVRQGVLSHADLHRSASFFVSPQTLHVTSKPFRSVHILDTF